MPVSRAEPSTMFNLSSVGLKLKQRKIKTDGMVAHVCKASTGEVEAEGSRFKIISATENSAQPGLLHT